MTTQNYLPNTTETQQFLSDLFDCEVTVSETDSQLEQTAALAVYINKNSEMNHFIALDVRAATMLGAVLTRFPPTLIEPATKTGEIPESVISNLYEVLNVGVNLFTRSQTNRLWLDRVMTGQPAEMSLDSFLATDSQHFQVDIHNYGTGTILVG